MLSFLFLAFFFLSRLCVGEVETCYSLDGSPSPDFPCDPGVKASTCCAAGYIYDTNRHCTIADSAGVNSWWVGTCTDKSWQSPN